MTPVITIVLAFLVAQENPKQTPKPPNEEEFVVTLPEGEPPPLPERVQWDLKQSITAKTDLRERMSFSGFWRFAPLDEPNAIVKRSEMGWIELPQLPTLDGSNVFDSRFRESDGLWRGKPLDKSPFMWVERDITIKQEDSLHWLNRRVILVLKGPWVDAEVFASQRIPKRADKSKPDETPESHVHVEPVAGRLRDGTRWCEITEHLIYPGTTQISMRLKRDREESESATPTEGSRGEPYVGLELWPTGPRIEQITLKRDSDVREVVAAFQLLRPKLYVITGMPPVRTIPLALRVRVEDVETKKELAKVVEEIGPIADLERTVTVRIPWPGDQPAANRVRLRAQLTTVPGGVFDEPFPAEFVPAELNVLE